MQTSKFLFSSKFVARSTFQVDHKLQWFPGHMRKGWLFIVKSANQIK